MTIDMILSAVITFCIVFGVLLCAGYGILLWGTHLEKKIQSEPKPKPEEIVSDAVAAIVAEFAKAPLTVEEMAMVNRLRNEIEDEDEDEAYINEIEDEEEADIVEEFKKAPLTVDEMAKVNELREEKEEDEAMSHAITYACISGGS